jgi:FixJ family two-component response regulator
MQHLSAPTGPPIIAIITSASGLEGCRALLTRAPLRVQAAFVLVLQPDDTGASTALHRLTCDTGLRVIPADDGVPLRPGVLHIIPPGVCLTVARGVVHRSQGAPRPPLDALLTSLAQGSGGRSACIVLSGTGQVGAASLQEFAAAGGLVIAQDLAQAREPALPDSAIQTGCVARILRLDQMPAVLRDFMLPHPERRPACAAAPLHRDRPALARHRHVDRAPARRRAESTASCDLRQPLQSMVLLQQLAARQARSPQTARLVALLDQTVEAISALLESLDEGEVAEDATAYPESCAIPGLTVHVITPEPSLRATLRHLFSAEGWQVVFHSSAECFLQSTRPAGSACLLFHHRLPGMDGVALTTHLRDQGIRLPTVMLTDPGDVPTAVAAMKAGVTDLLEQPASVGDLLASIRNAAATQAETPVAMNPRFSDLTPREREVLALVLAGAPNKKIAADLGINQRTVENHRAAVMRKSGASSLPELVRLALEANLQIE